MGSNSTGTTGVRATVPAGTTLPARSFFLMVNTGSAGYSGTVAGAMEACINEMPALAFSLALPRDADSW